MSMLSSLSTPWMLMIDANGAVSPADDSVAILTSAGVAGGADSLIAIVLVVAIIGGVSAMVAGDAKRKARERGR